MLQRIQSIYIFLACVFSLGAFYTSQDLNFLEDFPLKNIIIFSSILWSLLVLFSYKNRKNQRLFIIFNILINLLLLGVLLSYLLNVPGGIHFPEKGIELGFPLLSVICLLFANYFIMKDEKLVKSVDRLR